MQLCVSNYKFSRVKIVNDIDLIVNVLREKFDIVKQSSQVLSIFN